MLTAESTNFTRIHKIEKFQIIIKKLIIDEPMTNKEQSYILSVALIFLNFYKNDKRYTSYREFTYYIVLKYSLKYNDYKPLFDFSVETGFYPIAKEIIEKNLIDLINIKDILIDNVLETYKVNEQYIETLEQFKSKEILLKNELNEIAYIAPTSFGKSSIILDLIDKNRYFNCKTAIIVPTKSLLLQTYKMIRDANFETRLLMHDEMYNNEESFIAVFTQERALRLLNKGVCFDVLFIGEAHNLMDKDFRAILLSRLIKKNSIINSEQKVIYLSPLIHNPEKLKVNSNQLIYKTQIKFNLKEAEIYEYRLDKKAYKYNKFINKFYLINDDIKGINYIIDNLREKNFFYLRQPRKVENLAKILFKNLPDIEDEEINELIEILKLHVHEKFYVVDLLKKGIIYLHGKTPHLIKEYLEYKFKTIKSIKYLIANSVILEGINLPIDNLYVLNTYKLDTKKLTNLIGRVNRLDTIFSQEKNTLFKLLPAIHFINTKTFNGKNSAMKNKIELLRKTFNDEIYNPTLSNFDIDSLTGKDKENAQYIINNETILFSRSSDEKIKLMQYCIEHGINIFYTNFNDVIEILFKQINLINEDSREWNSISIFEKLNTLFIKDITNLDDFNLKRLESVEARNYYARYIGRMHKYSLKENINDLFRFFKSSNSKEFYIGSSYGESAKSTSAYQDSHFKVYIDLSSKNDKDLINLAIVKLQMEENFVKYTLTKFIEFMYEYKLITEQDYNLYMYGTEVRKNIELINFGLSPSLISKLDNDGQLEYISINGNGKINLEDEFIEFKHNIDDFYRFEIERYL
jgi:hypothetical protein